VGRRLLGGVGDGGRTEGDFWEGSEGKFYWLNELSGIIETMEEQVGHGNSKYEVRSSERGKQFGVPLARLQTRHMAVRSGWLDDGEGHVSQLERNPAYMDEMSVSCAAQ
jgi:hypothetical protein